MRMLFGANENKEGEDVFKVNLKPLKTSSRQGTIATKYSQSIIAPDEDMESLLVSEDGLKTLTNNFHDVVALAGEPGMGKSTLASTIYNVMRGDKVEYFGISDDMESFTKGIWSLNDNVKHQMAQNDIIDILDLEGIEDENVIHYLVVVAMVLSKAIVICNNKTRFNFTLLKLLKYGANMFDEYKIKLSKPVLFLQVPYGHDTFKLGSKQLNKQESIAYIKEKQQHVKDFDIRLFSLPDHGGNRFHSDYVEAVKNLISQVTKDRIVPGKNMVERVKYAKIIIGALNASSPEMVSNFNYKLFEKDLQSRMKTIRQHNIALLCRHFSNIQLEKMVTFEEFLWLGCPKDGKWQIGEDIKQIAQQMAYFDASSQKHIDLIAKLSQEFGKPIDPTAHVHIHYRNAVEVLKSKMQAHGNKLILELEKQYRRAIDSKIADHFRCVGYVPEKDRNLSMPYNIQISLNQKREELKKRFLEETENTIGVPKKFLNGVKPNDFWEQALHDKKKMWQSQKSNALNVRKDLVTTSGSNICPKCGKKHTNNVGHSKCSNNAENAVWFWVDYPSHSFVCSQCEEEMSFRGTRCWSCDASMNNSVISKTS